MIPSPVQETCAPSLPGANLLLDSNKILQPFSLELPVDTSLKLSRENFKESIKAALGKRRPVRESFVYPTPYILATFAAKAYEEYNPGEFDRDYEKRLVLPEGWKLLTTASNSSTTNGYFGAAFWNFEQQQVVISHRGTNTAAAFYTDTVGIVLNYNVAQMNSASTFADVVMVVLRELNSETNNFQLFFTGHSLGGWLAQITTFTTKYLRRYNDGIYFMYSNQEEGLHACAMVFDSPGCKEMLCKLMDSFVIRLSENPINLQSTLDITNYLSAPNLVNTCNHHIGAVYRIFPVNVLPVSISDKLSKYATIFKINGIQGIKNLPTNIFAEAFRILLDYTITTHDIKKIIEVFNHDNQSIGKDCSGKIRILTVIDWPHASGFRLKDEYNDFFKLATHFNDHHLEINVQNYERNGYANARYQTKPYDEKVCYLSVFTSSEREFLSAYYWLKESKLDIFSPTDLFQKLGKEDSIAQKYLCDFTINGNIMRLNSDIQIQQFIPYIKWLLKLHPSLQHDTKRMLNAEEIIQKIYQTETKNYLQDIEDQASEFFGENVNFNNFVCGEHKIWQKVFYDKTQVGMCRTYSNFKIIQQREDKFKDVSNYTILKLKRLLAINLQVLTSNNKLNILCNLFKGSDHLFLIECKELEDAYEAQALLVFKQLLKMVASGPSTIKVILVCNKQDLKTTRWIQTAVDAVEEFSKSLFLSTEHEQFTWNDITPIKQEKLLNKTILLQGNTITLKQLLFNNNNPSKVQLAIPNEALMQLDAADETSLTLGSDSLRISDLPAAYSKPLELVNLSNLRRALIQSNTTKTRFIISGLDSSSQFFQKLDIDVTSIDVKNISVIDGGYSEQQFQEFCHTHPDKTVHWIMASDDGWRWEQLFDPEFYITRKLKKVPVLSEVKNRLLDAKPLAQRQDFFVISGLGLNLQMFYQLVGITDKNQEIIPLGSVSVIEKEEDVPALLEILRNEHPKKAIHWLHAEGIIKEGSQSRFVWKEDIPACQQTQEDYFAVLKDERLAVIVDEPGMGKSTTLTELTETRLKTDWVIRINLQDCVKHLANVSKTLSSKSQALDFLTLAANISERDHLTRALLQCYYSDSITKLHTPLLILFDSFDEIGATEQDKVISLVRWLSQDNTQIVIASRRHPQLEMKLSLLYTIEFEPFHREQQIQLLRNFWFQRHHLLLSDQDCNNIYSEASPFTQYTTALLDKIDNILHNIAKETCFVGIPLQMRLLAEGFQGKFYEFSTSNLKSDPDFSGINIADIFQLFIDAKYTIYFKEKRKSAISAPEERMIRDGLQDFYRHLAIHKLLQRKSVDQLIYKSTHEELPSAEEIVMLYQVGLVQLSHHDQQSAFIHQTLVEFFTADLLVHQLKADRICIPWKVFLLKHILMEEEYQTVRAFLNVKLNDETINSLSKMQLKICGERIASMINQSMTSPLHYASSENNIQIIKFLIGALSEFADQDGLKRFINQGCKYEAYTPLQLAARNGNEEAVLLLLSKGADLYAVHPLNKWTPLHWGVGHHSIVTILVDKILSDGMGAQINARDTDEKTPLHLAALFGQNETVKYLLSIHVNGFEVEANARDKDGHTPLHFVAYKGNHEIVEILLSCERVEVNAVNNIGRTPLHKASGSNNSQVADLLIKRGAHINAEDSGGYTPLHLAVDHGRFDVAVVLWNQGAKMSIPDTLLEPLRMALSNEYASNLDERKLQFRNLRKTFR